MPAHRVCSVICIISNDFVPSTNEKVARAWNKDRKQRLWQGVQRGQQLCLGCPGGRTSSIGTCSAPTCLFLLSDPQDTAPPDPWFQALLWECSNTCLPDKAPSFAKLCVPRAQGSLLHVSSRPWQISFSKPQSAICRTEVYACPARTS